MAYSPAHLLETNVRLYAHHQVAKSLYFWFPTSILFFLSRVDLSQTLQLGAVYFLSVVICEVPSGWASDRFSRVHTLRLGAGAWILAYGLFVVAGSSFVLLCFAQFFLALGFASLSGTAASFHYESLEGLGRSADFEATEAKVSRNAFFGTAAAALVGGALGLVDLRLPYVVALCAALYQLFLTLRMTEPQTRQQPQPDERPRQLRTTLSYLRKPQLAWIFLFLTVQQPLESLASDLIQPWLTQLVGTSLEESGIASLYSGLLMTVIATIGALSAAVCHRVRERIGLRASLSILAAIEATILTGMALIVSPFLLPLLALRSTQAAAGPVLVAAAVAPHVNKEHRATFLSLGSFAGRGAYGLILLTISALDDIETVFKAGVVIGLASLLLLAAGHFLFKEE